MGCECVISFIEEHKENGNEVVSYVEEHRIGILF